MKIMMITTAKGAARADGAQSMAYEAGKEYTAEDWAVPMFKGFVARGLANEVGGNAMPEETKTKAAPKARKKTI